MGDDMTSHSGYDDAVTLIARSRKNLELDLRQCVEEVAGNISEYDTSELRKRMDRAFERHDKAIDRLFIWLSRLEKRVQNEDDTE